MWPVLILALNVAIPALIATFPTYGIRKTASPHCDYSQVKFFRVRFRETICWETDVALTSVDQNTLTTLCKHHQAEARRGGW